jgi:hypothetical protein|tara:strand:+ start:1827 stop:2180 length:354 start_codon:yes stop_codon:yes gene_type:complete
MGGRLPVDGKKVQEFRITLGTFERDRLDTLITGLTVKNIANPFVALISDVSAMSLIFSAWATYTYGEDAINFLTPNPTTIDVLIRDYKSLKESTILAAKVKIIPFENIVDLIFGSND